MVKQLGPRTAVVSSKELGTNCWLPKRFILGERCDRIWTCSYPEKKTCQAIHTEISCLAQKQEHLLQVHSNIDIRVKELLEMLEK